MTTSADGSVHVKGNGEMAELTRMKDWSKTPAGSINTWPQTLLTTVNIILSSKFPMFLWWGDDMIQFYNDAYRPSLGNNGKHPAALGQKAVDCWQEIWHIIYPLIQKVIDTGEPHWSDDQLIPIYRNGHLEDVYWTFSYSAVYDETDVCAGVLVTCMETTEKVLSHIALHEAKKQVENAKADSEKQRDRLKRFFMQAPAGICILDGPHFVFELINPSYQKLFPGRDLLGKPLLDALPELRDQPIVSILKDVYTKNEIFEGHELKVPLVRNKNGHLQDGYFNFIYQPRQNVNGEVDGIMVFVFEVTDLVLAKLAIEERENRFRSMVEQSPVPMLVTKGESLIFDEINKPMLELIGKDASVKGKPVYEAMPELRGQPVMDILYNCFYTGETWTGHEVAVFIEKNGEQVQGYYNVTYKAFIENGQIAGVLQVAVDVTEQVNARKKLEKTEDTLKLSLRAANLGTFDLDLEKGTMYWDDRCRVLFGISHHDEVSYEKDFVPGLHPEDRERITDIISNQVFNKAISNGNYDVEYRTIGAEDQKIRWVRAMGKTYFDAEDKPIRFIGSVLEITEQKEDELRKNDFIGMVSHELKTPLTSLKAYVQILQADAQGQLAKTLLPKADIQLKKMNDLVNGFLNISRYESGKLHLDVKPFRLDLLLQEIVEETRLISTSHKISFIPCNPINVDADKDKIESVLRNLLSNAVKYSPHDTSITAVCTVRQDIVEISVQDEGMGIKKEDTDKLFQRYYRVENNATKTISGFGIGLYLSAEIIKRHGGAIGVESEFGTGSRFYFTLPL